MKKTYFMNTLLAVIFLFGSLDLTAQQSLGDTLETFENSIQVPEWENANNNDAPEPQVVENPMKTGLNTSDSVMLWVKDKESPVYAAPMSAFNAYDIEFNSDTNYIHVKMLKNNIDPACLQVFRSNDGGETTTAKYPQPVEVRYPCSIPNQWVDYVFEFTDTAATNHSWSKFYFMAAMNSKEPDDWNVDTLDQDLKVYIDDIILSDSPQPLTLEGETAAQYTLPVHHDLMGYSGEPGQSDLDSLFGAYQVDEHLSISNFGYSDNLNFDYNYFNGYYRPYGWPSGDYDQNRYLEFSVAPDSGYVLDMTKITLLHKANTSNLGPQKIRMAVSRDTGKTFETLADITPARTSFRTDEVLMSDLKSSDSLIFRLYGYESLQGGSNQKDFWVIDQIEIFAQTNPFYSVNVTADPAEGGTVTGEGSYEQGKQVTLSAEPNTGYQFDNWTEDGDEVSTQAEYTFAANDNRDLTAHFSVDQSQNPDVTVMDFDTLSYELNEHNGVQFDIVENPYKEEGNMSDSVGKFVASDHKWGLLWSETLNGTFDFSEGYVFSMNVYTANPGKVFFKIEREGEMNLYQLEYKSSTDVTSEWVNMKFDFSEFDNPPVSGKFNKIVLLFGAAQEDNAGDVWYFDDIKAPGFKADSGDVQFLVEDATQSASNMKIQVDSKEISLNDNGTGVDTTAGDNVWSGITRLAKKCKITGQGEYSWSLVADSEVIEGEDMHFSNDAEETQIVEYTFGSSSYTIDLTADPSEGGEVSGDGSYEAGEEVTVSATASDGYSFDTWSEDGTEVSSQADYTFTVEEDRNLTAHFSVVSSIGNAARKDDLVIFPNPATNQITIQGANENIHVEVYNMLGSRVLNQHLNSGGKLDINQLKPGIYSVKIESKQVSKTLQLIVQ